MLKLLLNEFLAMFTPDMLIHEILILVAGAIAVIVGFVQLTAKDTRSKGCFAIVMGLFYSLIIFVTIHGWYSGLMLGICAAVSIALNLLSWVVIWKFGIKSIFIWLQGYLLVIPVAFVGGILQEALNWPDMAVFQIVILVTSILVEIVIVIAQADRPYTYNRNKDSLDDMIGNEFGTDITWMDDFDNDTSE